MFHVELCWNCAISLSIWHSAMTPRHREIIRLIALGASNKSMARTLGISIKTVEKHRADLMRENGIHKAADVTRFAYTNGLIDSVVCPQCGFKMGAP